MTDRKLCLLMPSVEGVAGGAEEFALDIQKNMKSRGISLDVRYFPFIHHYREGFFKSILNAQACDLSAYYGVITCKFPAYFIDHPNIYLYLFHQHRQLYEFFGTRFSDFCHRPVDDTLRSVLYRLEYDKLTSIRHKRAMSRTISQRLKFYFGMDAQAVYVPPPHRELYESGDYGEYALYVSRFEEHKRPHLFIEAFRSLPPHIKGIMVGNGTLRKALENMIEYYQLESRISIISDIDRKELIDLYRDCLCVVFCPFDEDYGYITLEAFMSKKPVITINDSGGPLEFVTDGVNGFVCAEDGKEIAERIAGLHDDREMARDMGNMGFERVRDISYDPLVEDIISSLGLGIN